MENTNLNPEETNNTVPGEETGAAYVSQFAEVDTSYAREMTYPAPLSPAPKTPGGIFKYINPCILIAFCIVLASLAAYGVYTLLLQKSITGAWVYKIPYQNTSATADEAKTTEEKAYYVFDKLNEKGEGRFHEFSQGAEQSGSYTLSSKDGKNIITMKYNAVSQNELTYEVTGTRLFGTAKLKFTQAAYTDQTTGQTVPEQAIELNGSDTPDYENNTFDNYKVDEKLLGTWTTDDRTLFYYYTEIPYSEKLEFTDNGIVKVTYVQSNLYLNRTVYYSYTADKGKLKFKRATSDEVEEVKYTLKNGALAFTDKTKTSIFYDAVFGDKDYKKK